MRTLARMRSLVAALALLCFLAANVAAGIPGRPIERPEGPPEPTTEVGDPEPGHGLPSNLRYFLAAALLSHPWLQNLTRTLLTGRSFRGAAFSRPKQNR